MVLRVSGLFPPVRRFWANGFSLQAVATKVGGLGLFSTKSGQSSMIQDYISKDDLNGFLQSLNPGDLQSLIAALKTKRHPLFENPLEGTPDWAVALLEKRRHSKIGEFVWTEVDKN